MIVFCRLSFMTGRRINILTAKLFTTGPTPGSTTARSNYKGSSCLEAACKNIVAGGIFEAPSGAPGTLFGVGGHIL